MAVNSRPISEIAEKKLQKKTYKRKDKTIKKAQKITHTT